MNTIYFDYNATTLLDAGVLKVMEPFLGEIFGNPSSVHLVGRRSRALLDDARDRAAKVFQARPSEICFTSGGTEGNNLAIFGTARLLRSKGRHLITSTIEHHSVLHCFQHLQRHEGFAVTYLPVSSEGIVSPDDLRKVIRPDTTLVSIMAANNETGSIQPVAELGAICRERGVLFHTDAVQWFGKLPFTSIHQFNADLVSLCAHKFHGPKGAGLLFIRSPLLPEPILFGGAHENERRAGTENLPAIIGLAEAIERFVKKPVFPADRLSVLTSDLLSTITGLEGVTIRGSLTHRLPNTVSFTVKGTDGMALMAALDLEGICASSGSACSAGSLEPSHVMLAMAVDPLESNSLVRFSLGRDSTAAEVKAVLEILPKILRQVRQLS